MVEYNLAKINVEGSSPFFRISITDPKAEFGISIFFLGNNFRIDVIK